MALFQHTAGVWSIDVRRTKAVLQLFEKDGQLFTIGEFDVIMRWRCPSKLVVGFMEGDKLNISRGVLARIMKIANDVIPHESPLLRGELDCGDFGKLSSQQDPYQPLTIYDPILFVLVAQDAEYLASGCTFVLRSHFLSAQCIDTIATNEEVDLAPSWGFGVLGIRMDCWLSGKKSVKQLNIFLVLFNGTILNRERGISAMTLASMHCHLSSHGS